MGLVAVAALAGAALWGAAGTASAETAGSPESARIVSFHGGCGVLNSGIGARSAPDTTRVSVPAGSEVTFSNRLGQPATLRLDGQNAASLAAGDAVGVVFERGPVTATMQISCLLGTPAGAVTVEVVPAPAQPQPTSPSSPSSPSAPATGSGTTPSGSGSGSGTTGGTSSAPRQQAAAPAPSGPGRTGGSEAVTGGHPSGGHAPGGATPGAWWIDEPGEAVPAGEDEEESELGSDPTRTAGDERRDLAAGGGQPLPPATVEEQPATGGLATEQLTRTAESAPTEGPVGLLALLATVCVVGVSAGAARTLAAQRARRAQFA